MGSYCEFSFKDKMNNLKIWQDENTVFEISKGQITDDSEMALSLCYALMDGKSFFTIEQHLLFFYYGLWSMTSPIAIGRTTSSALNHFFFNSGEIS